MTVWIIALTCGFALAICPRNTLFPLPFLSSKGESSGTSRTNGT